jgi:hypothetical protein
MAGPVKALSFERNQDAETKGSSRRISSPKNIQSGARMQTQPGLTLQDVNGQQDLRQIPSQPDDFKHGVRACLGELLAQFLQASSGVLQNDRLVFRGIWAERASDAPHGGLLRDEGSGL